MYFTTQEQNDRKNVIAEQEMLLIKTYVEWSNQPSRDTLILMKATKIIHSEM